MVLLEHAKIIETLIGKNFTGPDFNFQREREGEEENRVHSFRKSVVKTSICFEKPDSYACSAIFIFDGPCESFEQRS